ncbi:hypothetical protein GQX74_013149 [Glossina fuscipes]|nr:hypothetical protein GQX74_013149 [Glossina fuscipes]
MCIVINIYSVYYCYQYLIPVLLPLRLHYKKVTSFPSLAKLFQRNFNFNNFNPSDTLRQEEELAFTKLDCKLDTVSKIVADAKKYIRNEGSHSYTLTPTVQIGLQKPFLVSKYVQTEQFSEAPEGGDPKAKVGHNDMPKKTVPKERREKTEDIVQINKQGDWQTVENRKKLKNTKVYGRQIRVEALTAFSGVLRRNLEANEGKDEA